MRNTFSSGKNPLRVPLLTAVLAISFIAIAHGHNITVTRPASTVTISSTSPSFVFELNYPHAFDVSLANKTDPNLASFCQATFDEVSSDLQTEVAINFDGEHMFDNVVANENYSFVLDSRSLNVMAIDSSNPSRSYRIKSAFGNSGQGTELDETFLEIASDSRALYIVTKKLLFSYPLADFYKAITQHTKVPDISNYASKFPGFSAVQTVKYYRSNLYIVADNVVHIWYCVGGDVAEVNTVFDERFLGSPSALSIVDITFYDKYAFLLDSLAGVYVVDISKSEQQQFKALGLGIDMKKGQLIKAAGLSLNIITASSKTILLNEYSIKEDNNQLILEPNRQSEVYQPVISLEADDTFLYIITGFFNIIIRHSIPSNFDTYAIEQSLFDFWPLYRLDAFYPVKRSYGSGLVVVREDNLSSYTFVKNPLLKCDMANITEGEYIAHLTVRENTCDDKTNLTTHAQSFNVICETTQDINLIVANEDSDIGDVSWSYKATIYLIAGIFVLMILILVFCCLFRKYKRQYEHLQSKIKFKKLKGGQSKQEKGSEGSFNEGNQGNVGDWRQKGQKEQKGKAEGAPNFQNWDPEDQKKQSVQDLGDLKQLDYDDIYAEK